MRGNRLVPVATGLCLLLATPAAAAPGGPDPRFGKGGYVHASFGDVDDGWGVVRTADGKVVVAGGAVSVSGRAPSMWLYLTRYDAAGRTDTSFGNRGVVRTNFGGYAFGYGLAQDADGRLVAVASVSRRNGGGLGVARYLADGRPDTTFGNGGTVVVPVGTVALPADVAVDTGGAVVVAGTAGVGGKAVAFVRRFLADGSPDPAFGVGGTLLIALPGNPQSGATGLALLPGGVVLVTGSSRTSGPPVPFLVRVLPGGRQDPTFAGSMPTLTGTGFGAVTIAPDGGILVAGGGGAAFVLRFLPTGTLDPLFGTAGIATVAAPGTVWLGAVDALPDGRIVASGSVRSGSQDMLLVRLTKAGEPDRTFGRGGVAVHGTPTRHEAILDHVVGPGGAVTATGTTQPLRGHGLHTVTARFLG